MPKNDHYVIIGNGPAGNSAADTLRENDGDARITIISNESFSFYYRHKLTDFIKGEVGEDQLIVRPYSVYKDKNIRLRLGQGVEKIDPEEKTIYLKHMEKVSYTKLVIATGGTPRILPSVSNFSSYLKTMASYTDALNLMDEIKKASDFLVLGGDVISFKFIRMLRDMGKKVDVIIYEDAFWPFNLTEEMTGQVRESLARKNVGVFEERLTSVASHQGKFHVTKEKGDGGVYDCVFSFLGMVPNIKFVVGSGIDTDRGILVDGNLRANFEDVYACGDCAQIYNPEIKSYWVSIGWKNAQLQGTTAALNLLGEHRVIKPSAKKVFEVEGFKVSTSWWDSF